MELEKKKVRPTKRTFTGAIIRYHSLSMPVIEELDLKQDVIKKETLDESELDKIDLDSPKR